MNRDYSPIMPAPRPGKPPAAVAATAGTAALARQTPAGQLIRPASQERRGNRAAPQTNAKDRVAAFNQAEEADTLAELEHRSASEVLAWAVERFGSRLGLCSSFQAEGCVLIDLAVRLDPSIRVFTIDTGRLMAESYELIERMRERYRVEIESFAPDTEALERMVSRHGPNLFYRDVELRLLCCQVRKVLPLRRALGNFSAWATGLRREQWATRAQVRKAAIDHQHGGIVKLAPLADWSETQVWEYIAAHNVPYNPLYDRGFKSIGCAPCTRPVAPTDHPRQGRWWWENNAAKECGMHHCATRTAALDDDLAALPRSDRPQPPAAHRAGTEARR